MRILIFGATGFIGRHLTLYLASQGYEVVAFCRSGFIDGFSGKCVQWKFGGVLDPMDLKDADYAVHLAHDFNGIEGAERTLKETIAIISQIQFLGIKRQLFFSSFSAGTHSTSLYGRTKLAIEKSLSGFSSTMVVRPGLVLGSGGIYGRIKKWANVLPWIPLPDGGKGLVPVISIEALCIKTLALLERPGNLAEFNLFEPKLRSLMDIVLESVERKRKPHIIPIPTPFLIVMLRFLSVLKLPLPVNADNLEGFLANQNAYHKSSLKD